MSTPFNIGIFLMHPILIHNDTDEGNDAVQKNSDDDDSDESDDVLQKNRMQLVAQDLEDDIEQIEDVQANNEYVEPEDLHHDEFDDDWINSTYMKNIIFELNRSTIPIATRI